MQRPTLWRPTTGISFNGQWIDLHDDGFKGLIERGRIETRSFLPSRRAVYLRNNGRRVLWSGDAAWRRRRRRDDAAAVSDWATPPFCDRDSGSSSWASALKRTFGDIEDPRNRALIIVYRCAWSRSRIALWAVTDVNCRINRCLSGVISSYALSAFARTRERLVSGSSVSGASGREKMRSRVSHN